MFHATTILSVRDENKVVMAGDGQVSVGDTVFKSNAKKVRRLYKNSVLAGFAVKQWLMLSRCLSGLRKVGATKRKFASVCC